MGNQLNAIQDVLLSNVSSQFRPVGLISDMVLPKIQSKQSTGKLGQYGNGHLRIEQNLIGGEGKYRRVRPTVRSTTGYEIVGHGLEGVVTEDDYDNAQLPFDAEQDEVLGLTDLIAVEKEYLLGASLTNTSVLTQNTTLTGSAQFSDYSNSDPLSKFSDARSAVRNGCGMAPDTVMMDWAVKDKVKYHPQLLDYLGYKWDRPGGLNDEELAKAMGVKRVLIAEGMYNSAQEGQSDSLTAIWGKHIVFAVLPMKAMKRQVSLGYEVRKATAAGRRVFKYAIDNPPNSKGIIVDDKYDQLITNASAGYLIEDAIA